MIKVILILLLIFLVSCGTPEVNLNKCMVNDKMSQEYLKSIYLEGCSTSCYLHAREYYECRSDCEKATFMEFGFIGLDYYCQVGAESK